MFSSKWQSDISRCYLTQHAVKSVHLRSRFSLSACVDYYEALENDPKKLVTSENEKEKKNFARPKTAEMKKTESELGGLLMAL